MAHVELSLSGAFVPQARTPSEAEFVAGVERWTETVATAAEPCFVIDTSWRIVALSPSCVLLFGLSKPAEAVAMPLIDAPPTIHGVLRLIDFTADGHELPDEEIDKVPPLLAIRSMRLARGLMRVQPGDGAPPLTVDAIATPLTQDGQVVASLTFLSPVQY